MSCDRDTVNQKEFIKAASLLLRPGVKNKIKKNTSPASDAVTTTHRVNRLFGGIFKPASIRNSSAKIGRNEDCPCGSGKKFKRCHGRNK